MRVEALEQRQLLTVDVFLDGATGDITIAADRDEWGNGSNDVTLSYDYRDLGGFTGTQPGLLVSANEGVEASGYVVQVSATVAFVPQHVNPDNNGWRDVLTPTVEIDLQSGDDDLTFDANVDDVPVVTTYNIFGGDNGAGSDVLTLISQERDVRISADTSLPDETNISVYSNAFITSRGFETIHYEGGDDSLTVDPGQGNHTIRVDNGPLGDTDRVISDVLPEIQFIGLSDFILQHSTTIGSIHATFVIEDLSGAENYEAINFSSESTLVVEGQDGQGDVFTLTRPVGIEAGVSANGHQVRVVSGQPRLEIDSLGGDDTVHVDNSGGGGLINVPITFNGGLGSDELRIDPDIAAGSVEYTPGNDPSAGRIEYDGGAAMNGMSIDFTGLEPVVDLSVAGQLVVNGTNADNAINYTQAGNGNGLVSIDNYETIEFANKDLLVLVAMAGDDTINLNNPTTPDGLETIFVQGNDPTGSDTLIVNGSAEPDDAVFGLDADFSFITGAGPNVFIQTTEQVKFIGEADDTLAINGSGGDDTTIVNPTGAGSGTFRSDLSPMFDFSGVNTVTVNGGAGGFDTATLVGSAGDDVVTSDAATISMGGTVTIGSDMDRVTLMTLEGNDDIDLNLELAGVEKVVDAGAGDDDVDLSGTLDATTYGGDGDDTIIGSPLADLIFGGRGNDILIGLGGADILYGEDGNDLFGNPTASPDGVNDDPGNDQFFGGAGSDTFVWEPGDGSDLVEGGAGEGDQLLFFGNANPNRVEVFGGGANFVNPAFPTLAGDASRAVVALNSTAFLTAAVFVDTADVEAIRVNLLGGADEAIINNLVTNSSTANNFLQTGTDLASTAVRSITVDVGVGQIPQLGDEAPDRVEVHGRTLADNVLIRNLGLNFSLGPVDIAGFDYSIDINQSVPVDDLLIVRGEDGNDTIKAQAGTEQRIAIWLDGDLGDDYLEGSDGNDTLNGGEGEDTMIGRGGFDLYDGGAGFDSILIKGTAGRDLIDVVQPGANFLEYTVTDQFGNVVEDATIASGTPDLFINVEEARVEAGAGDDIIRVTVADMLVVESPDASLRFTVVGGASNTGDSLNVVDDGLGDTDIFREGNDDRSGSITIGPLAPVVFSEIEYAVVTPLDDITGGTGEDGEGRLVFFKHDPFENNNSLALATHLGANAVLNVDPTIDPGPQPLGIPGDVDWYRVEAEVTGTLDFQVFFSQIDQLANGRPGLPGDGDLDIELYDADGDPIDWSWSADDDERIRIPAVQGQIYYLRVEGYAGAINNYSISTINAAPPVPYDLELADNLVILTGDQETPPRITGARGTANFQYDEVTNTFDLDLFVAGIELADVTSLPQLTGAHIHRESLGVAGPVIVDLGIAGWTVEPAGIRLQLTGAAFSAAPADIAALLAGDTYINVHSTAFPAGEVRGQINIPNIAGVSDSGRSQFDDVTNDNTPTIFLRLDDAILLNDLPGNAWQTPDSLPPDGWIIPIEHNPSVAESPIGLNPGYRVAVYDEIDTHNPVLLGFAQPLENLNGVYSFTFTEPLAEGSHFISSRVQMIDPADNDAQTPATGFGPRSESLEIVVDTVSPPVVFGIASDATDGLAVDPGVIPQPGTFVDTKTNDATPTFWGTAEADAVVRVYADLTPNDGVDNFDVLLGMTVAVPLDGTNQYPNGQWTVTSTVNLNDPQYFPVDGLRRILVTAEDLAGNIDPAPDVAAEALEIYLDTQGPQVFGVFFTRDPILVGSNGNTLYRFRASTPSTIIATVPVIGLAAGEKIEGIDLRPADGLLYALINGPVDRLVTIDPFTGATTPVGNLGVVLSGSAFGMDFDPVTDELRVVSNFDQNLRVDPATGLAVADPVLNPGNPNVVSIACTNNTVGTDTTGLYGIDTAADTLVLQNPTDSGTLTTIGPLGVNATNLVGFDIMPELNVGYASIRVGVTTQLYQIDLATGAATLLGNVGSNPMLGGLTALAPYDVFDPKPSTDGPTPLVWEVTIRVQDLPARILQYQNPAVNELVAEAPGLYLLTGDANGVIPIASVEFLPDPFVDGQPASGTIVLSFNKPLPDDRFSLWISDSLVDDVGNKLDGESNADEPHEQPLFESGDGQPGGDFLARFTVDTRPEIATFSAGSVYVDTNGNFTNDPMNLDYTNRDLTYTMTSPIGFTSDNLFCGNFVTAAGGTADGFDKLAAYGRIGTQYRWLVDVNNDGVPDIVHDEPLNLNAVPFSGNFDGNLRNGSEVGLFCGQTWYFDTNHDFLVDAASVFTGQITGYPIVGDFDGDGRTDLGTYRDDQFFFQLGTPGGFSAAVQTLNWGFIGVRERPVAADMDQDGVTDIGLWVPDRTGTITPQTGEWYFLMSNDFDPSGDGLALPDRVPGTLATLNHAFSPTPLGHDIFARFGNDYAMPLVGNFDPPVAPDELEPAGVDVSMVGTPGADQMAFAPGATAGTWTVTINGVSQTFVGSSIKLKLDGRGGQDTVVLKGGAGLDDAAFRPGGASLKGANYNVTVLAESITIDAGGGPGKAVFYGAAGVQDTFTAQRGAALMTSPVTAASNRLYSRQALGFTQVQAVGSADRQDVANLTDAAVRSLLTAENNWAKLSSLDAARPYAISALDFGTVGVKLNHKLSRQQIADSVDFLLSVS